MSAPRDARSERAHDMYQAYLRGMTLAQVGVLYGIGPERVRQLFFMERLPTRKQAWRPPDHAGRGAYLAARRAQSSPG